MSTFIDYVRRHKAITAAAVGVLVVGGVVGATATTGDGTVLVAEVLDGDTITIEDGGDEREVRLLNVDTPEEGFCLDADAKEFLESLLPAETKVLLEYDEETVDSSGRDLAGVFKGEVLVSAEIARAGYGVAVHMDESDLFYDEVLAAEEEARAAGVGLHAPDLECSIEAEVSAYVLLSKSLRDEAIVAGATLSELDEHLDRTAAALAVGVGLAETLDGDRDRHPLVVYPADKLDELRRAVTTADETVAAKTAELEAARVVEEDRLAAEEAERVRIEAERIEAERLAAEEAARLAAEEAQREADAAAAAERERAAAAEAEREAAARRNSEGSGGGAGGSGGGSGSGSGGSGGGSGGGQSGAFANCTAARDAGAAPVYRGQPGYGSHLDRDGDGIGCES
ncbi:excalibur calcium-binding domain-containing protein [Georgenia wangjunii]|uniref:excalibur calcium-binding domain-containing protein n=1 Tax=Georgenia wangjunii TaxID=3117730 RepID=UPI002F267BD6